MRALIKAVKTSELDPNAGKARLVQSFEFKNFINGSGSPDQLMVQDDPAFSPEFALAGLDIDLSALDISTEDSSRRSSILSPPSQRSSLSSHEEADESMLGLIIPTSDTGGAGDLGGFLVPAENVSSAQRSEQLGRFLIEEEEGFNFDPGFSIDADGNLIEEQTPGQVVAPPKGVQSGSDALASGREREELSERFQAGKPEVPLSIVLITAVAYGCS